MLLKGKKNAKDISEYFIREKSRYSKDAFYMRFTTNHDENTWNGTVFERLGKGAETFGVFTCAITGMPLLYNGQEAGLNKRLKFFEKDPIKWKHSEFRKLYTTLFNEKIKNHALWNGIEGGDMIPVSEPGDTSVIAFVRDKDNDKVFTVFNLSNKEVIANLQSDEIAGSYRDLFTNELKIFTSKEVFKLKPWDYKFYVKD